MAEMLKAILTSHGMTVTLQQFTDSPDVRAALKSAAVSRPVLLAFRALHVG